VERPRGFAAAVGVAAGGLWLCVAADAQDGREAVRLCGHDPGRSAGVLSGHSVLCRSALRAVSGSGSRRW
jgi:hypothetical protein